MRLFSFGLIICTFFSSIALVNGIKAYRTNQISDANPDYLNFYVQSNESNKSRSFAEFCNYKSNTCQAVADLAPIATKTKSVDSDKVLYSLVYPPHTKTHKQLVLKIHYDPEYGNSSEPEVFINNETTILMEFQWTKDKIAPKYSKNLDNLGRYEKPRYELEKKENIQFTIKIIVLNLIFVSCVFFGSFVPGWCPILLSIIFILAKIKTSDLSGSVATLSIVIVLLINWKLNTEKRFIIVAIGGFLWEVILLIQGSEYRSTPPSSYIMSFLIHLALICIARCLTADKMNRWAIISSAYIGSTLPVFIYYVDKLMALPHSDLSRIPSDTIIRHILCLIGIAFQAKALKSFEKPVQTKEKPALLEEDKDSGTLNSNHESLTNSLL